MSVDSYHDDYLAKKDDWERCRDFIEGASAVKARGTEYLPALTRQKNDDYEDYLERALFYGASGRTHIALVGSVFRKAPMIKVPDSIDLSDVSMMDLSMVDFSRKVVDEVLQTGRYGVLVEFSDEEGRPYFVGYKAENITNWRVERREGRMETTLIVLKETEYTEGDDEYTSVEVTRYRTLRLVDGVYTVTLHSSIGDTGEFSEEETIVPTRNGEPLSRIPFHFFGPSNLQSNIQKPPLLDLVEVNKSHFQSSADLENGRHMCGLPTPIFVGFDFEDGQEVVLGVKNAIHSTDTSARAYFMEFGGAGLSTLERGLSDKEHLMSVMGARLLEPPRVGVEAAETARIRQAGESSLLGLVTTVVSEGLTNILSQYAWWSGLDTAEVSVQLNTDFIDYKLAASDVAQYVSAYLSGGVSFETLFYNLQKGEIIPPDRTMEDEERSIEQRGVAQ